MKDFPKMTEKQPSSSPWPDYRHAHLDVLRILQMSPNTIAYSHIQGISCQLDMNYGYEPWLLTMVGYGYVSY